MGSPFLIGDFNPKNEAKESLSGKMVEDLLIYPAQVIKFYSAMRETLNKRDGQFLSYCIMELVFFALLLPHCASAVKVHEVYVRSPRKKRRAVDFLLDIYTRNKYARDVRKERINPLQTNC